jgi:hypothetical protein
MTLAEFPEDGLPAHRHAVAAKVWLHERFTELARQLADVDDPDRLADNLTLIYEAPSPPRRVSEPTARPRAHAHSLRRLSTGTVDSPKLGER